MTSVQPWSIDAVEDQGLIRVVISLTEAGGPSERDALLGRGIVELVPVLVSSTAAALSGGVAVVLDIRCEGTASVSARAWEAFIEATRGLVQSFVLEQTPPAAPVNIVVSDADQGADRDATWRYLGSADGRFSWGSTYDLREVNA